MYYPETIKEIKFKRQIRWLKTEIHKIVLRKTVYGEFVKGFEDTFSLISDLKNNQSSMLNYMSVSFKKKNEQSNQSSLKPRKITRFFTANQ